MEDIFLSCLNLQNTSFFPMFRSLVIGLSCSEFSAHILDAYDLKKAQTRDDFYIAMKAKRRLGRLFDLR